MQAIQSGDGLHSRAPRTDNQNINIMTDDISVKVSPFYNKYNSLTTSTPHKSINDSGYSSPSSTLSNVSSNIGYISEVSISLNHSPSNHDVLRLTSTTHNHTLNNSKLDDITVTTNSFVKCLTSSTHQEISPTKKCKISCDLRMRFHINKYTKDDDGQLLRRKNTSPKTITHERISVDGREKVDIMYYLAERHRFEPVTEKIFSYLSGSDIISMSMVSKVWCNAVQNSPMAQLKKLLYFKLSKENRFGCSGRDRSTFPNKGCLANIGNVMRSPSKRDLPQRSPPVSPSKYRFYVFQKEAKKLSSDQQLVPCPRCSRPASWSPSISTRAECKGLHCKFIFCTNCMCEYSTKSEHKCLSTPIFSMSSYNRRSTISTKAKRKHNLRRLCNM